MLEAPPMAAETPLEDVLRARFGLDAFRPWQKEAIDALASPLPIDETTPPVTNTYFVGLRLMRGPS